MARIIKLDQVEKSVLEAALATCSDLADQRRLTVALQAMGGRSTAQEIAEKNGVSRSTVFNWIKLLRTNPIGAFFRIRSNRPVRLSGKQLIQLRQECASGSIMNAKQLRHRLVQLGMAVSAPSAHYWLDRIRGVSENRERGEQPRIDSLRVEITAVQRRKIAALLPTCQNRQLVRALKGLELLADRSEKLAKHPQPTTLSVDHICSQVGCSVASLYRWANRWRRAPNELILGYRNRVSRIRAARFARFKAAYHAHAFDTASEAAGWLMRKFRIRRNPDSLYRWLHRCGPRTELNGEAKGVALTAFSTSCPTA